MSLSLVYTVQLDVSGNPFGATFVPTDISTKALVAAGHGAVAGGSFDPITITWGRQDQYSDLSPTTVTGSLLNTDGTFSPGNTGSTYSPNIRRGLRRRVLATVNGGSPINLSEDYATSLEVVPASDSPAVTNLEGSDILARFGGVTSGQDPDARSVGTTMRTFLAEEMMLDDPSFLYMLQEADGATAFGDVTGNLMPLVVTSSKYGPGEIDAAQTVDGFQGGSLVGITNANYGLAGTTLAGSWLQGTVPAVSHPFTVEMWIQAPITVPSVATVDILITNGFSFQIQQTTGFPMISGAATGSKSICDGGLHQLIGVVSATSTVLYIDGVSVGSLPAPIEPFGTLVGVGSASPGGAYFTGAVAYVGLFPSALSSTRVTQHYLAGTTAFAGLDTTDERVTRLLSYRTNTGSNLDTGLSTVGLQDIAGRSLQDCLLEVAQVEAGALFVDGTGRTTLRSRSRLFNPTSTVTLDMKAGGVQFGSNWREDTQNVLNDVDITNETTGSDQRVFNAASITQDGEFSTSLQLPTNLDTDALSLAGWLVGNGTLQQLTATPLVIDLLHLDTVANRPTQVAAVLGLMPLDCIQLNNCPSPAPSSTMQFIVQGGTTSLGSDASTLTLNVTRMPAPVAIWDTSKWDDAAALWAF